MCDQLMTSGLGENSRMGENVHLCCHHEEANEEGGVVENVRLVKNYDHHTHVYFFLLL